MIRKIQMLISGQSKPIDIIHYLVGNYRYNFYYGGKLSKKFSLIAWLRKRMIRRHIKEQIAYRIEHMDKQCYREGQCKICTCQTTHLQMANKSCEKPCYPPMMNKRYWRMFNKYMAIEVKVNNEVVHVWLKNKHTPNNPILYKLLKQNNQYVPYN